MRGCHLLRSSNTETIIAMHRHLRAQFGKALREVVGKRVIVVDEQQAHARCFCAEITPQIDSANARDHSVRAHRPSRTRASAACSTAHLASTSSYSRAG